MRRNKVGLVCVLLLAALFGFPGAPAAGPQDERMAEAIRHYRDGEWEAAVNTLEKLLSSGELAMENRSEARKYLGLAWMSLGDADKAVSVFKAIVREDPAFDMNAFAQQAGDRPPVEAVRHFGQAVVEVRQEEIRAREERLSRASSMSAVLRSAALPGWGQRYLGHKNRGYLMLGMAAVSVAYAITSEVGYRSARDDYNNAARGADFDALHSRYVTRSDRANLAWGVLAGVWLFNMADAGLQGRNIAASDAGLTVQSDSRGTGLRAMIWKRF